MCVLGQLHFDVATWSSTHRRGLWRQTRAARMRRVGDGAVLRLRGTSNAARAH